MGACRQIIPVDIDNDGNQDLVCPYDYGNGTSKTFVMRSLNGTSFGNWESWGGPDSLNVSSCSNLLGGDVDGNGQFDLICLSDTGNYNETTFVQSFTGARIDLLDSVEDGMGAITHIEYKPLTDSSVYTRDALTSCPGYPTVCVQTPMFVVSSVNADNGIGGKSASSYHYAYGRANVRGRGWLGFGEVTSTDHNTDIVTKTRYNQAFSADTNLASATRKASYVKSGLPEAAETRLTNGSLIGTTVNNWNVIAQNSNTRFELQSSTSTDEGYELNGGLITTVLTSNSDYDLYGNVGKVTVSTTGGGETFTKVTTNTYANDISNWYHVVGAPDSIRRCQYDA